LEEFLGSRSSGLRPVEDYLNSWVCSSKSWEDALNKARKRKMTGFDPYDPMDADDRTAAEHYIFGRYLASGGLGVGTRIAYVLSGSYWAFGYEAAKASGFYPNASPSSYAQLYWGEKAYTDAVGLTETFTGSPGNCGCGSGE
jgi:hypothetical protein